jgi:hypothetical protein
MTSALAGILSAIAVFGVTGLGLWATIRFVKWAWNGRNPQ